MADFPVDLFDRTDGRPARWPTLGVKLTAGRWSDDHRAIGGPVDLGLALLSTVRQVYEERGLAAGHVVRTMFIDTAGAVPRALVCISNRSQTLDVILENGGFAINVLRASQASVSDAFAGRTTWAEKFATVGYRLVHGWELRWPDPRVGWCKGGR